MTDQFQSPLSEPAERQTSSDGKATATDRGRWVAALATQPADAVIALADRLGERYRARHVQVPQAGLAMMCVRESVLRESFHLGEIPLSSAQVELTTDGGQRLEGAAVVMADDAGLAAALAVCDAVLAGRLEGHLEVAALLEAGRQALEETDRMRRSMLRRSRVDFSLLNQEDKPT